MGVVFGVLLVLGCAGALAIRAAARALDDGEEIGPGERVIRSLPPRSR